jgi:hypothetical protein
VSAAVTTSIAAPLAERRLSRAAAVWRRLARGDVRWRFRCLLLGHEDAFARRPGRLQLRCLVCGRETVGWTLGPGASAPVVVRRPAVVLGATVAVVSALLLRPWALWWARREGRDRQRLRMVVAAERAASRRADDGALVPSLPHGRSFPRAGQPLTGQPRAASRGRAGFGDYGRSANGSASPARQPLSLLR